MRYRIQYALMFFLLLTACTAVNGSGPASQVGGTHVLPTELKKQKREIIPIKQILTHHESLQRKDVTLKGTFLGWSGICASSSPFTRSDWILEDETGCIYVTGILPTGLSPSQPKGEPIIVTGQVIISNTGKPVFKAHQLTKMPYKE